MTGPNPERWLAHYDRGVPHTLEPYPNRTLVDYFADAAGDVPAQAASGWHRIAVDTPLLRRPVRRTMR